MKAGVIESMNAELACWMRLLMSPGNIHYIREVPFQRENPADLRL